MQIITLDNLQFPEIQAAWNGGQFIGNFWKDGKERSVCASSQFLLVASENGTNKFAIKPTRNLEESIALALQLLRREEKRGNQIKLA